MYCETCPQETYCKPGDECKYDHDFIPTHGTDWSFEELSDTTSTGTKTTIALHRDPESQLLTHLDVFLEPRVQIQIGRSSLLPKYFWAHIYAGVANVRNISFLAHSWTQATRAAISQARMTLRPRLAVPTIDLR